MFHHLSHTAHWAISIHNILEVSWTSHKTIQVNLKHSQFSIKALKSFSVHKVCFYDQGLFKFHCFFPFSLSLSLCKGIDQFTSTQCECLCVPLFLDFARVGLTSGSTRSAPDISAPLLSSFSPRRLSATALLIHRKQWNFYIVYILFFFLEFITGSWLFSVSD